MRRYDMTCCLLHGMSSAVLRGSLLSSHFACQRSLISFHHLSIQLLNTIRLIILRHLFSSYLIFIFLFLIKSFICFFAFSFSSIISFYLALFILFVYSVTSVLAGGVLTAYVGVVGLIKQLASDRCLPSVLLTTNRFAGNF
jgi:hypothetical protein